MMRDIKIKKWDRYYKDIGLSSDLRSKYLEYISLLKSNGFPVIFEFIHLAQLLGKTEIYLASAINGSEKHYREFQIAKKRGGKRKINAPYPALLDCQRWINSQILAKINLHEGSHGFRRKRSIKSNASVHLGNKCLLKVDIKNYFDSIVINRVIKLFRNCGYTNRVSYYLAALCCVDNRLPQGAATSPAISNIISKRLDARMTGLAKRFNLVYSRYADDINMSGGRMSDKIINYVEKIIIDEGFELQKDKTKLARGNGKKIVTGISVAGPQMKIPNAYKRKLRQEVYYIDKYGYFSHVSKKKIRNPFYLDSIYGKILFVTSIEPDNVYFKKALDKIKAIRAKL